jgi:hypothetical protein
MMVKVDEHFDQWYRLAVGGGKERGKRHQLL